MVELNGALSNPRVVLETQRNTELVRGLQGRSEKPVVPKLVKPRPGATAEAVFEVLSGAQSVMRAKEIQQA